MSSLPPIDPQKQLQWLVDRAAIGDLLFRFARCIDEHDQVAYTANFTEDGVLELPFGTFEGRAAIAKMPVPGPQMATHHISANHQIQVHGDIAISRSYLIATHVFNVERPGDNAHAGGCYDCTYRRTPEGGRLTRVKLSIVWNDGEMIRRPNEPAAASAGQVHVRTLADSKKTPTEENSR